MRPIDLQNVVQNVRFAEHAQANVQRSQEFAQAFLAKEMQEIRQQELNTVRDVKHVEDRIIQPDEHKPRSQDDTASFERRATEGEEPEQEENRNTASKPIRTSDTEGLHIDVIV